MSAQKNKDRIQQRSSIVPSNTKRMGVVRIVGGKFKRTPLTVDDRQGLRPTSERVRETVFDWLTHLTGGLEGLVVLDAFAGSGAMGLEAASRGAAKVVCVEKDRRSAGRIRDLVSKLQARETVEVICGDVFDALRGDLPVFDIVFIDPPFASQWQMKAIDAVKPRIHDDTLLYIESDRAPDPAEFERRKIEIVRQKQAGAVFYLLAKAQKSVN